MFIPKSFPFITTIGEEGDNGGGTDTSIDDLGVPETIDVPDTSNASVDESNNEVKPSPAWQKVLDVLPSEFHKQILPEFDKWDKNFAEVQSKFAPYKPLVDNNVTFEDIQNSFKLAEMINVNPRAIYDELGKRFGFANVEQGLQQIEAQQNQEPAPHELGEEFPDISKHPQFVQLQQMVNNFQQSFEQNQLQQQQYAVQRQAEQEINTEWQQLESKLGRQLPEDVKTEIINRAVIIGDRTGNYSVEAGYTDYANFVNRVRNSRANATAPTVLSGNGGIPVPQNNIGKMSREERVDYIASYAENLAKQNQQ